MRTAEEQERIERECRQEDLVTEAEALTWALYGRWMKLPMGTDEQHRVGRIYERAERRLGRRFGGMDAYWESVAL